MQRHAALRAKFPRDHCDKPPPHATACVPGLEWMSGRDASPVCRGSHDPGEAIERGRCGSWSGIWQGPHVAGNAITSEPELCLWCRALLRSRWQDGGMAWQGAAFHRHACCTRVAAAVPGALSRKDLGKRRLPRETRSMAASACMTSWVLRGAGMWPQLGVLARRKVDVALVAPCRGRAGAARRRWQRAARTHGGV